MARWMFSLLFGTFIGGLADAKTPEWAKKNTQALSGKTFTTTCSGTGPSIDTARRDALDSCRLSARQQLAGSIKVISITIQSEKSAGFHEEISEDAQYSGLICKPVRDEVEEVDGGFQVWMQCRFDLGNVKVVEARESPSTDLGKREAPRPGDIGGLRAVPVSEGSSTVSEHYILEISVVPKCDSLIVKGLKPRQLNCSSNPMRVILFASDREILVRAAGFRPKTVKLEGEAKHESIQVLLERN